MMNFNKNNYKIIIESIGVTTSEAEILCKEIQSSLKPLSVSFKTIAKSIKHTANNGILADRDVLNEQIIKFHKEKIESNKLNHCCLVKI